ncbi:nitrous oxide reductase accessory protein NosL [Billgrantia diversa]|uniref:nitrous oxide reductase accessory protein NosL n=1 Tax=Halomonas sp. MCCC 1A13316 TaxID=2733487 RepID=UPI0018A3AB8F|nr:nitrous oxide reductase accessory protein NosL [Halomonas sp. MCCC 1A13316]QOR37169.1 nitrous oxide reductase accessory protein NosL [Halomonas sp. MCCC 1A13316]
MSRFLLLPLLLLSLLLAGCGESEPVALAAAEPIESGDSCHVCGMLISEHPGPKGEAFLDKQGSALKFCSTAELFTFLRQPENETRLSHAYVHDVAAAPWATPDDEAFVLASEAWYVAGHDQRGSMGHTLASFKQQSDAETFRAEHGGELYAYADIDLELLARLSRGELGGDEAMGDMAGHGSDSGAMHATSGTH